MSRNRRQKAQDKIKARLAEGIVEALLEEAGNRVKRFGQEWQATTCQEISPDIFKYVKLDEKDCCKPDLVVKNLWNRIETVEVKFSLSDLIHDHLHYDHTFRKLRNYWPNTRIVLIRPDSNPIIEVLNPPYVDKDWNPIAVDICSIAEWGITGSIFEVYAELISKLPKSELQRVWQGGT